MITIIIVQYISAHSYQLGTCRMLRGFSSTNNAAYSYITPNRNNKTHVIIIITMSNNLSRYYNIIYMYINIEILWLKNEYDIQRTRIEAVLPDASRGQIKLKLYSESCYYYYTYVLYLLL